jgi:hypothetical protein
MSSSRVASKSCVERAERLARSLERVYAGSYQVEVEHVEGLEGGALVALSIFRLECVDCGIEDWPLAVRMASRAAGIESVRVVRAEERGYGILLVVEVERC